MVNTIIDLLLVGYSHEHDYEVVATSSDHLARVAKFYLHTVVRSLQACNCRYVLTKLLDIKTKSMQGCPLANNVGRAHDHIKGFKACKPLCWEEHRYALLTLQIILLINHT